MNKPYFLIRKPEVKEKFTELLFGFKKEVSFKRLPFYHKRMKYLEESFEITRKDGEFRIRLKPGKEFNFIF